MAWGAVIDAAANVVGGVMGSSSAKPKPDNVQGQKKIKKHQEEHNKKVAKLTNKHNDKLDIADVVNYEAMREYSHETSIQNWQRGGEIQDYQYLQKVKRIRKKH